MGICTPGKGAGLAPVGRGHAGLAGLASRAGLFQCGTSPIIHDTLSCSLAVPSSLSLLLCALRPVPCALRPVPCALCSVLGSMPFFGLPGGNCFIRGRLSEGGKYVLSTTKNITYNLRYIFWKGIKNSINFKAISN